MPAHLVKLLDLFAQLIVNVVVTSAPLIVTVSVSAQGLLQVTLVLKPESVILIFVLMVCVHV